MCLTVTHVCHVVASVYMSILGNEHMSIESESNLQICVPTTDNGVMSVRL